MTDDVSNYSQQTKYRLVIWFVIILFTVGLGLIWIIYGARSALLGLLCLIGTTIPIGLIALLLIGLDKIVNNLDH